MISIYLLPVLFLILLITAALKKVPVYHAFCKGAGDAIPLVRNLFPFLCAVLILGELMRVSGVTKLLGEALAPALSLLGIPKELAPLTVMKPFSGSASLSMLAEILKTYGADSMVGRCAAVVYGSSETVFYVTAVYFANAPKKQLFFPVAFSLGIGILTCAVGCALLRVGF